MRIGQVFALMSALTCAAVNAHAAALPYTFQKVAQTGSGFGSLGAPSLNEAGVSAFQATVAGGPRGVYYGVPGAVQQVATPNLNVTPGLVDINQTGQIVFTALPPTNPNGFIGINGVYRSEPAGGLTTIAEPWSAVDDINGGPVINNGGLVAFTVHSGPISRLLVGNGSAAPVSRTSSSGDVFNPRLNNDGQAGAIKTGAGALRALFFGDRDIITLTSPMYTDPEFGVPGTFSVLNFDVADGGRVAFFANFNGMGNGIYTWVNDTIQKVAGSSVVGPSATPAINDLGTVAAALPGRISVFHGGEEGTVISVGDAFDGSTVTGYAFSPEGFNNQEQLAFTLSLADGRQVNVLATVPEPGAGMVIVAGAAVLLRRRR
jgi:hypothetical protein